ncbi:MAG: tetratricopeptide repeat protein [Polyangiaceae bacterium]
MSAVGFFMVSRARTEQATQTQQAADPRVATFLAAGESALSQGNLELAKENLDKASALAEKNPEVLLAVARLAASRADLAWLRQKVLVDGSDDARVNKQQLDDLAAAARKAADEAQKGAPDNAALVRARIDALRISGDTKAARDLVDKILATGSQPETAYVLAALDLAEKDPPWSVVLSRLRTAAAGEGTASRARAALVVALAQSGDGAEARRELDRLASQPRVHPLLPALRAYLDRIAPAAAAGKDAGAQVAAIDVKSLPGSSTPPSTNAGATPTPPTATPPTTPTTATGTTPKPPETGGSTGGSTSTAGLPSDPRTLIRMAEAAKGKRDLERAKTLYEAAIAKNGGDSEALAGLGDVLRAQGDVSGAQSYYKRALAVNPSYLPALIGLADVQWDGGDKAGAQKAYRDIVDRFPEPAYPSRVKQRAEGGG